jgi:hypothetical protein
MAYVFNPFTEELDVTINSIDELTDVDTTTSGPSLNYVLKWNGTNWVPGWAGSASEFTFNLIGFTDDQTNTQLIGSGIWLPIGSLNFTMTYDNGPPASGHVELTTTGSTWQTDLTLTTPFTSKASVLNTWYPNSKDDTITFTLKVNKEGTVYTDTEGVLFRNYVRWGTSVTSGNTTSGIINSLTGSLTNDQTDNYAVNSTAGSFIIFAYPSSYTSLHDTGVLFQSMTMGIGSTTGSVTNGSGFIENYKIYYSLGSGLGNSTLTTSTTSSLINQIKWGDSLKSGTYLHIDVSGLDNSTISNTNTGDRAGLAPGNGSFIIFAHPNRLTTIHGSGFRYLGMSAGFETGELGSFTNPAGYIENYRIYRSTGSGLGASTLTTYTTSQLLNQLYYGYTSGLGSIAVSGIRAITSTISDSHTTSRSVTGDGVGSSVTYAHPARLTTIPTGAGSSYGFLYGSRTINLVDQGLSTIINDARFSESYRIYKCETANLGNATLGISTSTQLINDIYWGDSKIQSGFNTTTIKALTRGGSTISNQEQRSVDINAQTGSYMVYAYPTRLGSATFYIGGFEGGFQPFENINFVNGAGFGEVYKVYASTNAGLGSTTVVISGT